MVRQRMIQLLLIGALALTLAPQATRAAVDQRCFAETGQCVQGRFLAYWEEHGGLALNGYPLSNEFDEALDDGKTYRVQYFERVRLEYHPENPEANQVLLGQFGRRVLREEYVVDRRSYDSAVTARPALDGQQYFNETGHNLGGRFLDYWQAHGGLAQFGYPITEERFDRVENGQAYRTQYFERARFEYHPENDGTPYEVLLGQFGRRVMTENQFLTGELGAYFQTHERTQVRLGSPVGAPLRAPGTTLPFQQGLMVWAQQAPSPRGITGGFLDLYSPVEMLKLANQGIPDTAVPTIIVLCGEPDLGAAGIVRYQNGYGFITDTWNEGDPAGGGAGPQPGLYAPSRGFGKVWGDQLYRGCVGYATAPNETAITTTVQYFRGGAMLLTETPTGRYLYIIAIGGYTNSGPPHGVYERVALPVR